MPDLACPVCGSLNAPTRTFCWKCAAELRAVVADPAAPPPPPKVIVPIQPLLIGGGVALAAIALIALAVVLFAGSPAATPLPSFAPGSAGPSAEASGGVASAAPSAQPTAARPTDEPATPTPPPTQGPPATPKVTPIPAPAIISFKGPATVNCADPSFDGFVTLTWLVTDADSTELSIDGPGIYQSYPGVQGNYRVPFGCGAGEHRYTLTTVGGNGPAATRTLKITEG